jgi:hypothetical protein
MGLAILDLSPTPLAYAFAKASLPVIYEPTEKMPENQCLTLNGERFKNSYERG